MGNITRGLPIDLAEALRRALGLKLAVETGTFQGESAAVLSDHFSYVWTIELSAELSEAAATRYADRSNIEFVQGSSADRLAPIALGLSGPTLYWLDGHWSGGVTAGEDAECPILAELDAIDKSPHADRSAILIDDARMFLTPPPPPHRAEHWPDLMDIADKLRSQHCRYVTVLDDVLIAVPPEAKPVVAQWWLSRDRVASAQSRRWGDSTRQRFDRLYHYFQH